MLSPREIALAEERRQCRVVAEVAREHIAVGGGSASYSGPGAWSNFASGLGLDGPVDDPDLDRLVVFYEERGVPARITICPYSHPTLLQGLAARGFAVEEFQNVLARELCPGEDLRAALPWGWPPGIEVRAVGPGEGELFVHVSGSGFVEPGEEAPEEDRRIAFDNLDHPTVVSLMAWAGGRAAGAGSADVRGTSSALFGATVLPEFRRRGIQQALIVARLEHARDRGATQACITSTPGIPTERNAMRLGFAMAYSKASLVRSHPDVRGPTAR